MLLDPLARLDGLAISPVAQGGIQAGLGGRSVVGIGQIGQALEGEAAGLQRIVVLGIEPELVQPELGEGGDG